MSSISVVARALAFAALFALSSQAAAQSAGEIDPELRVQQLENQLRVLTGQNEELQYRNRRLEEQLRQLQGAAGAAPGVAAAPPPVVQPAPAMRELPGPAPTYEQPPSPRVHEQVAAPPMQGRRRGDAFDPNQSPNAPGVPRALGGGQLPMPADPAIGAPGGRGAGEPLDLANAPRDRGGVPPRGNDSIGTLATLPPSQTPRDEFDLGIGYMQRKDYALAEETMRAFAQKYPGDPLVADSQYWLGESFFQRQRYRDSAEAFLAVTTKYEASAKAPDSLLRLGQSLAALKEKEAACAALGEVARKYPRASTGVKQAVDREQKRIKC